MAYAQGTVARPKIDFAIRIGGKRFKAGEEMWVMTPAHAQKTAVMIGKKHQSLGCGYYFSLEQCEELFTFEPRA